MFAVIAWSACAKIEAEFVDPGTPMTVVENGFERTVVGPGYTMTFHGGDQNEIHLPESLKIAGRELLALAPSDLQFERSIGFGLFPVLIATFDTGGRVLASEVTTNDDGPFVAQIGTKFTVEYSCDSPIGTHEFTADSVFTFFPNGRIVRSDEVVPIEADATLESPMLEPVQCEAGMFVPNASLFVTSYWAFEGSGNTVNGGDEAISPTSDTNVPGACSSYPTHAAGVQYAPAISRVVPDNNNADTYVRDLVPMNTMSIRSGKLQAFSAVQLADRGDLACGEILAQLAEPPIRVGDQEVPSANKDGIYDDPFNPRDDAFDVVVVGDASVPAGWVLSTELSSDTVRITRDPPGDPNVAVANVQRLEVGLNRFLLIFNEALDPGVTITIEPL